MKPKKSYVIWFSQRTGSTLLCKALESTGVAGRPNEWLLNSNLKEEYNSENYSDLQQKIWNTGLTENGVFGVKVSYFQPNNNEITEEFKKFPGGMKCSSRPEIWENAFPNCKHIFMTRRNKFRLAVSWWKAIKTNEFHRKKGELPPDYNIEDEYLYDAIDHLVMESNLREAGIQQFFSEGNITPLTIVYEDFINNYEDTVYKILKYLEIPDYEKVKIEPPFFEKLADDLSEKWVQRFREERQKDWENNTW